MTPSPDSASMANSSAIHAGNSLIQVVYLSRTDDAPHSRSSSCELALATSAPGQLNLAGESARDAEGDLETERPFRRDSVTHPGGVVPSAPPLPVSPRSLHPAADSAALAHTLPHSGATASAQLSFVSFETERVQDMIQFIVDRGLAHTGAHAAAHHATVRHSPLDSLT